MKEIAKSHSDAILISMVLSLITCCHITFWTHRVLFDNQKSVLFQNKKRFKAVPHFLLFFALSTKCSANFFCTCSKLFVLHSECKKTKKTVANNCSILSGFIAPLNEQNGAKKCTNVFNILTVGFFTILAVNFIDFL